MKSSIFFSKNKKGTKCLNCESTISENNNFCPNCGQVNDKSRLSLKQYFAEYLSGFFSFDNRFIKTVIPLIFKPGKVTREYIEGKRKKYVNPFQLYLNITIIFFLLIGLFSTINNFKETQNISEVSQNDPKDLSKALDTINKILINENGKIKTADEDTEDAFINFELETDSIKNYDLQPENKKDTITSSTEKFFIKITEFMKYDNEHEDIDIPTALNELGYEVNNWNIFYFSKAQNINKFTKDPNFIKSYSDNIISKISVALFLLLPIFTLIVAILYIRNKYNYSEHLVFVFHTQTVFFILLIFFIIIDRIFKIKWGITLSIFLFLSYLYIALRNFYKQGWFKTFAKYFILNFFYLILALIGGILVSFIVFLI